MATAGPITFVPVKAVPTVPCVPNTDGVPAGGVHVGVHVGDHVGLCDGDGLGEGLVVGGLVGGVVGGIVGGVVGGVVGGGVVGGGVVGATHVPDSSTTAVSVYDSSVPGQVAVAVFDADVDVPGIVAGLGPDHVTTSPGLEDVYVYVTRYVPSV
jgi:hypothetical protein